MKKARGFTVIELLIVTAIVAVLAGILMPVLLRSKRGAEQTKCASNLMQLGSGFTMYASDYDGDYYRTTAVDRTEWAPDKRLTDLRQIVSLQQTAFAPYIHSLEIYRCPNDCFIEFGTFDPQDCSRSYFSVLGSSYLYFDPGSPRPNGGMVTTTDPSAIYLTGDFGPNHNFDDMAHSTNVAFLDGHVKLSARWTSMRQ